MRVVMRVDAGGFRYNSLMHSASELSSYLINKDLFEEIRKKIR